MRNKNSFGRLARFHKADERMRDNNLANKTALAALAREGISEQVEELEDE